MRGPLRSREPVVRDPPKGRSPHLSLDRVPLIATGDRATARETTGRF